MDLLPLLRHQRRTAPKAVNSLCAYLCGRDLRTISLLRQCHQRGWATPGSDTEQTRDKWKLCERYAGPLLLMPQLQYFRWMCVGCC